MEIDDSGPAFPSNGTVWSECRLGITKREWFAGMAMQGFYTGGTKGDSLESIAELSFRMADSMIDAGKKR
jgi:hypothetical protein